MSASADFNYLCLYQSLQGLGNGTYSRLFQLEKDKDHIVIIANVDNRFQKAGFEKHRLFYTQGDYELFQCSEPCHNSTYENEEVICDVVARQTEMSHPALPSRQSRSRW